VPNKTNEYYYLDIDLKTMTVIDWGEVSTATHTGDTSDPNVHRIFLTKGQYNKLKRKISGTQ
jgi:hypothetical protein